MREVDKPVKNAHDLVSFAVEHRWENTEQGLLPGYIKRCDVEDLDDLQKLGTSKAVLGSTMSTNPVDVVLGKAVSTQVLPCLSTC